MLSHLSTLLNYVSLHTFPALVWNCQASDHKPIVSNAQPVSPPQELFLAPTLRVEADTPSTGKPIAMVSNTKHTHMTSIHIKPPAAVPCVFNEQREVELHYDYLCWQLTGTSCGGPTGNKAGSDCGGQGGPHMLNTGRLRGFTEEKAWMFKSQFHLWKMNVD